MKGLPPAPRDHRARIPNRAEVAEEMFHALEATTKAVAFQVSRQASLEALGPFAALFEEFMARQAALEDFVGFVYVPKAKASDAPPASGGSASPLAASGDAYTATEDAFLVVATMNRDHLGGEDEATAP